MTEHAAHAVVATPARTAHTGSGHKALRTPAAIVVSLVVHAALLIAMGSVVWHTGILAPGHPSAAFLSFDNPSDAAPDGSSAGGQRRSGPAYHPSTDTLEATLEPLIADHAIGQPIEGLASAQASDAQPLTSSVIAAPISGLSTSLFSSLGDDQGDDRGIAGGGAIAMTPGMGDGDSGATVSFAGLGARGVGSVVYVVDLSGSMVTSLPLVLRELERSIAKLAPTQKFGVIVCRRTTASGPAAEAFAPMLVRSTPSVRQLLHDWLHRLEPTGRSSPLAGLEAALSLKPDAVFLLARSIERSGGGVWEQGFETTMGRLEQLNPGLGQNRQRRVLIQTIQFIDEDPSGVLQAIGERHGGGVGYRVVKRQQDIIGATRSTVADHGSDTP